MFSGQLFQEPSGRVGSLLYRFRLAIVLSMEAAFKQATTGYLLGSTTIGPLGLGALCGLSPLPTAATFVALRADIAFLRNAPPTADALFGQLRLFTLE